MSWIFGKKKTPAELLRENKRMLDKAIRELDRERMGLQAQEKKLVGEIKKMAKEGQMEAVKVMAKSLVRNRHAVNKMFALKSQLQAVSLRIATLKSTHAMAQAMQGATKAMAAMNRRMNLPALAKIMREFERQNEKMEMTSEMMGDAVDGVFEEGGEEEETDELVNQASRREGRERERGGGRLQWRQVLDEIGINLGSALVAAPGQKVAATVPAQQQPMAAQPLGAGGPGGGGGGGSGPPPPDDGGLDDDLQARLNNLRKS
eukprot:scaffold5.g885.t1